MKAAIVTIGDELTCGYRLDTNSQTISRQLATVPMDVLLHLTVGDEAPAIHRALSLALDVADAVIVTGGLGPTVDDLTRQAVAAYFGLELLEDAEALERIRERFARRDRAMPESNRIQAHVPAGSQIIQNDRGTAPGFYVQQRDRHLFVTPGIPSEMQGMLERFILPRLRSLIEGNHHVLRAALKVYGLPESEINERLGALMARGRNPLLGLLPHRGTITIEIVSTGESAAEAEALLSADLAVVRERLGRTIISEDERELPQVVADLLVEHGLTVATAELGTGGLVAAQLTRPDGSRRWFRRGLTLDASPVSPDAPPVGDQAEEESAQELAALARHDAQSDVGIGVGEISILADSRSARPYGVVPIAIDLRGQTRFRRLSFNGDRARVREWAADAALALLRVAILKTLGST
jgi:nicotinamide-nucleotide amidase